MDPVYRQIRELVYKVSGIYKAEDKLYLLADGCGQRMKQLAVRSPREYWDKLTAQPSRDGEQRQLLNELTIGETCLSAASRNWMQLRKVILPETVTSKTNDTIKRLRSWSAGCSTGEESYTLAMNMLEERDHLLKGWTVEILATDLNDHSIEAAKGGHLWRVRAAQHHGLLQTEVFLDRRREETASHPRGKEAHYLQPAEPAGRLQDAFHEKHGPGFLLQCADLFRRRLEVESDQPFFYQPQLRWLFLSRDIGIADEVE
jgi:chemotaxis methyl-accepting protein methylase